MPQCVLLALASTQPPSQNVPPAGHWQLPPTHDCPPGHALSHPPQWLELAWMSEDNRDMLKLASYFDAKHRKTYRVLRLTLD